MHRRRFLTAVGAAGALAMAGCLGEGSPSAESGSGGDGMSGGSTGDTTTTTADEGALTIETHPAATDLRAQPRKGDLDGHVVLAFEDPSCSRCRAFEQQTVPRIESELVESGRAAFVFRGYPVVYPWGGPAAHALEATYDRSATAFWALLGHYFETQSAFTTDNVLDRTERFLADATAVDGTAVVTDVEQDAYDAVVAADLEAGRAADLGEITPIVLLFKNGEYVTTATGSVSYEIVATALGEA